MLYQIRRFEETVLGEFSSGVFSGTTHTYLGQEANAVGVLSNLNEGDIVFSNHRCHGHFLAYGGDMQALFAEMMGKPSGVGGGRGGSQHIHWKNFYSNGIQGSIAPVGVGAALAEKYQGTGAVTVIFLGDGTLGAGVLYEALNLASLWQAPVFFVLENNRIAQTTPLEMAVAGGIAERFRAFDIPTEELDSSDVLEILPAAQTAIAAVRKDQKPKALVLHTHRFGPHSKGDDTRPEEVVAEIKQQRDPVRIHSARLDGPARKKIESQVDGQTAAAFEAARQAPAYNGKGKV